MPVRPATGTADTSPWSGGDIAYFDGGEDFCTTGYYWGGDTMSTAGHCGSNKYYARIDSESGKWCEGTTYTTQFGDNRIDMQLPKGSDYKPYVWAGPNDQNDVPVSGSGGVAEVGKYCTDLRGRVLPGHRSGARFCCGPLGVGRLGRSRWPSPAGWPTPGCRGMPQTG
jgi:hypothetical protein